MRNCGTLYRLYNLRRMTKKAAHTRLPSVRFRSWSRFLAVSLQVTWVINPAVGCHYFPPGLQLPRQPLRGLLPILLLGEQRHNGCEQFAYDCYPTAKLSDIFTTKQSTHGCRVRFRFPMYSSRTTLQWMSVRLSVCPLCRSVISWSLWRIPASSP